MYLREAFLHLRCFANQNNKSQEQLCTFLAPFNSSVLIRLLGLEWNVISETIYLPFIRQRKISTFANSLLYITFYVYVVYQ